MKKGKRKKVRWNQQYISYGIVAAIVMVVLIALAQLNSGYLKTQVYDDDIPPQPTTSSQIITDDTPLDPYPSPADINPVTGACYYIGAGAMPGLFNVCSNGMTENSCAAEQGAFSAGATCINNGDLGPTTEQQSYPCNSWNKAAKLEEATQDCLDLLQEKFDNYECDPGFTPGIVAGPTIQTKYDGEINSCDASCSIVIGCQTGFVTSSPMPTDVEPYPNSTETPTPS
jgi:hypothetical protein